MQGLTVGRYLIEKVRWNLFLRHFTKKEISFLWTLQEMKAKETETIDKKCFCSKKKLWLSLSLFCSNSIVAELPTSSFQHLCFLAHCKTVDTTFAIFLRHPTACAKSQKIWNAGTFFHVVLYYFNSVNLYNLLNVLCALYFWNYLLAQDGILV